MALTQSNNHTFSSGELVTATKLNNVKAVQTDTATNNNNFTGSAGQLTFDTTANKLRVHDGSTSGGLEVGAGAGSVTSTEIASSAVTTDKIADGSITASKLASGVGGSDFDGGTVGNSIEVEASVPQLTLTDTDEGSSELGNQAIMSCNTNAFRVALGNDTVPRLSLTSFPHPTDSSDPDTYSAIDINSGIKLGYQRSSAMREQVLGTPGDAVFHADDNGNLIYQKQANGTDIRMKMIGHTNDDVNSVGSNASLQVELQQGTTQAGETGYRNMGRSQAYQGTTNKLKELVGTNLTHAQVVMQYQRPYSRLIFNQFYTADDPSISNYGNGTATGLTNAAEIGTTTAFILQAENNVQKNAHCPIATMSGEVDLGATDKKYRDIYATNNVIQTSDRNLKQDIEELSEAEKRVATACKSLIKKFRYKDAVLSKGDDARIHIGVIAQEVEQAFANEGLDGTRYGILCINEQFKQMVDGVFTGVYQSHDKFQDKVNTDDPDIKGMTFEKEVMYSIRYDELLAFIISAL